MRPPAHVRILGGNGQRWWLCECESWQCRERLELTAVEAEALRERFPRGYVVAPDHVAAGEQVVYRSDRYVVVETEEAA